MSDLKIVIGADIGDTKQKLETVAKGLEGVSVGANKAGGAMGKSVTGINQAGQALTNVGRVAQDLPFGFIGIQNNLNPLLESFQRLRVEAGSNVGALKALGSSLIGAGGLGLALSVVSSAILLYQKYAGDSADATKKNTDEIKLSVSEYDRFAKELEQVTDSMSKEAAKVSILFSALSDSNIGLRERKGILEQLNQISPGYLGQLDKEKAAYEDIAKAVFAYTDSLAKSAEIKALLPQVDKLFKQLIDTQVQLNQLRRFGSSDKNFFGLSPEDLAAEEKRLTGAIKSFQNQIRIAKAGLSNFAGGDLSLSEILFGKTPELGKPKAEKDIETVSDVLDKLSRQIRLLNEEQIDLGIDKAKEKISAIYSAINTLSSKFKLDPKNTIIQKLFGDINELKPRLENLIASLHIKTSTEILIEKEQAEKEINDKLGKVKMTPIKLNLDEGDIIRRARKIAEEIEEINQWATDNLKRTFNDALASIGQSIADSLSTGADFGSTVFGNLFKVLGAGLKQIGEAMIALGTAKIALEKFKFAPGIGTVIAGIAAVALGALLEKAIPGFAAGVTNFGGGLAVVGERGPELVRLPRGSDVIPNHLLGGVGSAGAQVFIPDLRIRGNDLVVVFNRTNQTIGRNG